MLKKLLQLLLNTRTTPEEAAHSAMPSDKYTRLVDNGTIGSEWTPQAFSGIAAYDGYLFFAGTSTSAVPIVGISTAGCASNLTFPWEGARLATTIPIAKGQTWTVQGSSLKDVIIDLSKTVALGGGYNSFVWRAMSCLRALSNCLQKVFSRAKRRGYLSGRSNCLTQRQSLRYQRQTLGQSSQCRLTVGQLLKVQTILQRRLTATFVKGNIKCSVFASVVSPTALQQFLFRVKKVKPSALPFTQTVRTSPLEHLKHFHLANLQTRGASC